MKGPRPLTAIDRAARIMALLALLLQLASLVLFIQARDERRHIAVWDGVMVDMPDHRQHLTYLCPAHELCEGDDGAR